MKTFYSTLILCICFLLSGCTDRAGERESSTGIDHKITAFAAAIDAQDADEARSLAQELSEADFSNTPLDDAAQEEMKIAMATALADLEQFDAALNIISPILATNKDAYDTATDPDIGAYYRHKTIDLWLTRADIHGRAGNFEPSISDLESVESHLNDIHGEDRAKLYFLFEKLSEQHGKKAMALLQSGDLPGAENQLSISYNYEDSQGNAAFNRSLMVFRAEDVLDAGEIVPIEPVQRSATVIDTSAQYMRNQYTLKRAKAAQLAGEGQLLDGVNQIADACMKISVHLHLTADERAEIQQLALTCLNELKASYRKLHGLDESTNVEMAAEVVKSPLTSFPPQESGTADTFGTITVFYGTNRKLNRRAKLSGNVDKKKIYTTDWLPSGSPMAYGSARVTVPKRRKPGSIPRPFVGGAKDGVHIVLKSISPVDEKSEFSQILARSVASSPREDKEVFVFVHGHAVSFAAAARRTAQLAVDLDIKNGATFFSWPAGGSTFAYQQSQNNVDRSVPYLVEFLRTVREDSGADKIHIIAHSMGNRVLLGALAELKAEGLVPDENAFDQVVWASPDVDADDFGRRVDKINQLAKNMTVYASDKDKALSLSKWLAGKFPRAGQTPPIPSVLQAVDTVIDTSDAPHSKKDIIAHTDYTNGALSDLQSIIWLSLAPNSRCVLSTKQAEDGSTYWAAQKLKSKCDETAFTRAVNVMRQARDIAPDVFIQNKIDEARNKNDVNAANEWQSSLDILNTYLMP